MEQKLKVAVIGCGGISGCHLEAYSKNPNVEIYALCDVNEKNLNRRGDQYHVERRYRRSMQCPSARGTPPTPNAPSPP